MGMSKINMMSTNKSSYSSSYGFSYGWTLASVASSKLPNVVNDQ
jgi:hypothetical protein